MKIKSCVFEIKALQQEGAFKGYASIFNNKDHHGDVVCKGAFLKSLNKKPHSLPKMLWQHDPEQPIGVWTQIKEDEKGLYVEGKLLLELTKAKEAYALLKEGAIEGLSIGYVPKKSFKGRLKNDVVNYLEEIDLKEISLVTFAANEKAKITYVKNRCINNPILSFCQFLDDL